MTSAVPPVAVEQQQGVRVRELRALNICVLCVSYARLGFASLPIGICHSSHRGSPMSTNAWTHRLPKAPLVLIPTIGVFIRGVTDPWQTSARTGVDV